MDTTESSSTPQIFAHRGSTLLAPENTIAAFNLAIDYQSDVLETDVRLSRDGAVIVTHDETLERTTNGRGRVRDYDLSELKKLDAGVKFRDLDGNHYEGETLRLLTLNELFDQYPRVGINIDIKDKSTKAAEAVAAIIQQRTTRPNPSEQGNLETDISVQWINVGSFHAGIMQHFRSIAPQVNTAATRQEVARIVFGSEQGIQPAYQVLQIPQGYWGIKLNRNRLINKVHRLGCKMVYWTVNERHNMEILLQRGCDGIVTDRPDLALKVFEQFGHK